MIRFRHYDQHIATMLKNGEVLLHPTDTVWGLAAAGSQKVAVDKIYSIKNRDKSKPLILLVDSLERLKKHVISLHPRLETLLTYHERPLTIIYNKTRDIPDYLKARDGTIGIRIVNEYYCRRLIKDIDEPLVSTSANLSSDPPPGRFADISQALLNQVDVLFQPNIALERDNNEPSVVACMDEDSEELIFLRE